MNATMEVFKLSMNLSMHVCAHVSVLLWLRQQEGSVNES